MLKLLYQSNSLIRLVPFKRAFSMLLSCSAMLFAAQQVSAQAKLDFSHERGFSDAPFNLTITPRDDASTIIRYTLDGEEPSPTSGQIYTGSIPVQTTTVLRAIGYIAGVDTSKVYTHTYLFLNDVIQQPANIDGWPNSNYSLGGSGSARHDYEMDPAIVNSSQYSADLLQGLKDIPSMSIVMPKDDFFDVYDGDAERKTSIELLYADDPDKNEQEDGGIEPHSHDRLKRSLRLSFKSEYGAKDWDSDIFRNTTLGAETAVDEFDRIVLRGGNNRAWSRNWNEDRTAFTRDEWFRQSQIASSGIGSHGTFVHLYVNGLYWGLYNPVERPDEDFTSSYAGGNDDEWFAISHGGVRSGDRSRYDYLNNVVLNKNLTNAANYEELKSYLDVNQFSDYILLSWMTGVQDWPGNNWWAGNNNNPAGPLMYFGWDNEWSWDVSRNANEGAWVHPDFRANDTGGRNSAFVFNKVKVNDDFMMGFADRVYKLCFNDGPMTDDNSRERWAILNNEIENAVVAESARWGDSLEDGETRTRDEHWQAEVDRVDGLMDGNVDRLINALLNEGYYPSIDPPLFENNNQAIEVTELAVNGGYAIDLVNPNSSGVIYYTTNGVDPRMAGGDVTAGAIAYAGEEIVINGSTNLLARVKTGNQWSALHCLNLIVDADLSWIKLTEIMYNPQDLIIGSDTIDGNELEFLEIKNTNTSQSLDISGLQISDGVEYTFPTGTVIPPQSFLVVASNAEALAQKCSGVSIIGEYEGQLSNGGENIDFATFQGDTIIRVEYDDNDPWPIEADGEGYSLVSTGINPVGDQDDLAFWKLSFDNVCGSPGADDVYCSTGAPDSDNDGVCDAEDMCPNLNDNLIGTACNDGDDCTTGDVYNDNCECAGEFQDSDGDGICDAEDDCSIEGQACNDGDICTINDSYDADCNCIGVFQDSDGDGICDAEDDCDEQFFDAIGDFNNINVAGFVPAYADNARGALALNAAIYKDEYAAATMIYSGAAGTYDLVLSTMAESDGESTYRIAINGTRLAETFTNPVIFGTSIPEYAAYTNVWGGISLSPGDEIRVEFNSTSNGEIPEGTAFAFSRGRWTSLVLTCNADECDNNLVGQACNDGDACTVNDTYDANCNCVGVFQDTDNDGVCNAEDECPALDDSLIGTACNDGNACTTNDIYTSNCECEGTYDSGDSEIVLSPIDDAYLQGTTRYNNNILRVESGNRVSYLKFAIPNNAGTLVSAQLEMVVSSDPGSGQILAYSGSSSSWTEANLSVSNRPSEVELLGSRNNTYNSESTYTWELDQSELSAGQITIIMRQTNGNDVSFHSNEASSSASRPQLVLMYSGGAAGGSNAGNACDDGDPCTINDTIDDNCNCVGVFQDTDNDGVCNAEDQCAGFNDALIGTACNDNDVCTVDDIYTTDCECAGTFQDSDNDGICDAEDDCSGSQVGQACDDGDACTVNDRYDANCNCVGVFQDTDNDGVCNAEDQCAGFNDALIGTACNDNDVCTIDDIYTTDCECAGTFQDSDNDGICDAEDDCSGSQVGQACDDGDACTVNDRYDANCNCVGVFQDTDNDGVCNAEDQCAGFNDALIGTACNDNDICTVDDIYTTDCECAGTFQDSDNDGICDAEDDCSGSQVGQACDDGDACTVNDRYDANCNCVGVFQDTDNDGVCNAEDECPAFDDSLIGTACNDGDACTTGELWTSDCNCAGGQVIDADNDGYCAAEDSNDNDPCVPDNSDSACNTNQEIECSVLASTGFENGDMGIWIDGGTSARLLNSASFANNGISSFYVQGNTGRGSSLYSTDLDLHSAVSATIKFNLLPYAVEPGDSFVLEVSTNGTYTTYKSFSEGTDFDNQSRESFSVAVTGIAFSETTSFRLRATSNDVADYFIFDDIVVETCIDVADQGGTGTGGTNACEALSNDGFENGNMGIWIDGGTSARLLFSASFAKTGSYSVYIQSNDGQASSVYTAPQDYSSFESLNIEFDYYAYAVEFGDSFVVEIDNGNGNYAVVESFNFGQDFQNFERKVASVAVTNFNLSNEVSVRIRSATTDAADYFILDDIQIEGCGQKEVNCTVGASCQPTDPCYVSGQYDVNCNCVGDQIIDADGDGYCAAEDTDDNNPCVPDSSGCGGTTEDCEEISTVGFENGLLGVWNDGGASARLLNSATFSPSGRYCFYVQGDNGASSSLYSNEMDFSQSTALELTFTFFPYSMETGDKFHLEINNGSGYQTFKTFESGNDFSNETIATESISIPASFLSSTTSLRFRSEGDQTTDYVMIDDVIIEECSNSVVKPNTGVQNRSRTIVGEEAIVLSSSGMEIENIYPNPANDEIVTIEFVSSADYQAATLNVVDVWGKAVMNVPMDVKKGGNSITINPTRLSASTYFIFITAEGQKSTITKFVKFN